jgi:hypothetical protein
MKRYKAETTYTQHGKKPKTLMGRVIPIPRSLFVTKRSVVGGASGIGNQASPGTLYYAQRDRPIRDPWRVVRDQTDCFAYLGTFSPMFMNVMVTQLGPHPLTVLSARQIVTEDFGELRGITCITHRAPSKHREKIILCHVTLDIPDRFRKAPKFPEVLGH